VFDTGNARKTDPVDAHAVAMAALRTPTLKVLTFDEELLALRLLVDRRDELSALRVQTVNRLHRLLAELIPGGAPRNLSATKAKKLLAGVRPRTLVGKTTRRMAAEELADLVRVDTKLKSMQRELKAAVLARGSHLMDLHGIGPAGAARILADVGDIARFPDRDHFASWTGTAPLDASSGEHIRQRLSRAGNRRMNHVLYIAAITQIRQDCEGRRYFRRKLAEAKTGKEGLRCLKRRLSDLVYRQLRADAKHAETDQDKAVQAGPGGHWEASPTSSAADLHTPVVGFSDQPQPEPAEPTLPVRRRVRTPHAASAPQPPRRGDKQRRTLHGAETAFLTQRGTETDASDAVRGRAAGSCGFGDALKTHLMPYSGTCWRDGSASRLGRARCRGLYLVPLVFGSLDISTGGCLQQLEGTSSSVRKKGNEHDSGNRQVVQRRKGFRLYCAGWRRRGRFRPLLRHPVRRLQVA
jgi:transposase